MCLLFSNILSTKASLWLGSIVPSYSDEAMLKGIPWLETVFSP